MSARASRPAAHVPTAHRPFTRRDWLVAFLLALATIQTARADFFVNDTFLDWHAYALGEVAMPYQGRAAMVPLLRWAGRSPAMQHIAARYARTVEVGTILYEPVTVEKFVSLVVGLLSLAALMLAAFWWSRRHRIAPWWLCNVLVLLITAVTVALRATTNYWYAYDLPHAALFGIGTLLALEGLWPAALLLFAIDVPLRETALYSIILLPPIYLLQQLSPTAAATLITLRSAPRAALAPGAPRAALTRAAALASAMFAFWAVVRLSITRHYAHNLNQTYPHIRQNVHELLLPHHWPQLFSAGGYLLLFSWLERRRLPATYRALLFGAVLCLPITLWFGVWTETRVWLEWTLPLALLLTLEAVSWLGERPSTEPPHNLA